MNGFNDSSHDLVPTDTLRFKVLLNTLSLLVVVSALPISANCSNYGALHRIERLIGDSTNRDILFIVATINRSDVPSSLINLETFGARCFVQ